MRGLSPLHNAAFAGNLSSAQLLGTLPHYVL
jgi:hypothetical protein